MESPSKFFALVLAFLVPLLTAATIVVRGPRQHAAGGGSPVLISNVGTAGTANGVTSGAIDTSGANLIVINASWYGAGSADVTPSDSASNTWTALTRHGALGTDTVIQRFYYCYNPTTSASHTFTLSGTGIYPSIQVAAFSNIAASPADQENGTANDVTNWDTMQPGSITPSQANTVVVVGLSFASNSGGTITIDGSYSITNSVAHSGNNEGGSLAYKILSSATAQNPTWSTSNQSTYGSSGIASFKY